MRTYTFKEGSDVIELGLNGDAPAFGQGQLLAGVFGLAAFFLKSEFQFLEARDKTGIIDMHITKQV